MVELFTEGFDKYGPAGTQGVATAGVAVTLVNLLTQGEWTSITAATNATINVGAPLSATGQSLVFTGSTSNGGASITKTLATTYSRLIGGVRFSATLALTSGLITFQATGTAETSITLNSTGTISLVRGAYSGTVVGTSSTSVAANSTHYLEWDITFGASGAAYNIYLDGTSILSGTGNTSASTAINGLQIGDIGGNQSSSQINTLDDLYLFDSTGSVNNAIIGTNPVVATTFGTSDSSVAFTFGAGIVGKAVYTTAGTNAPGVDLFLIPVTPIANCTLNSISCLPEATSATVNFKSVLYSDNSGAPGSLVATGTQATGTTSGSTLTSAFSSGQSLTSGTQYWIGYITDTSIALQEQDSTTVGQKKANTYASGAPAGPLSGMTTGQTTWLIWGNVTGVATNYTEDNLNPALGALSYVTSATVAATDLYGFGALPGSPGTIYTTCVKANAALATSGSRTVSLQLKSGSTTSAGSASGQTPLTTQTWLDSFYDTDPNTGVAWTVSGLNAATSGLTVAS